MKAYETSERYIGKVRECCNYSVRSAKKYLDEEDALHRQCGGKGVEQLRDRLQGDLEGFADTIDLQPISVDKQTYVASNLINTVFMLLSAALAILGYYFLDYYTPIILAALVFSTLALIAFFGGFGFTSKNVATVNVFATRKCNNPPSKRVILQANLDAPNKRKLKRKPELIIKTLNFISILLYLAFDITELLINANTISFTWDSKLVYLPFGLAVLAFLPLVLTKTVAVNSSNLGVADNLIGCYTACGAMRYLSEMDLRLENTEVCVLLTDGKSSGNEGAKLFLKEYKEELQKVDTTFLCLDSLYELDTFNVQAKGRKLNKLIDLAANNAGVLVTDQEPKYHKNEAKAFTKAGYDTASVTTLPDTPPAFYRSDEDNQDVLNVHAVEAAIKFSLEFAYAKDAGTIA
ncbi:MAG TPA: hypothetical protein PLS28_01870 [Clostridiales bacterium]|nr:hypothetical protein [Clostridiales bacterium]